MTDWDRIALDQLWQVLKWKEQLEFNPKTRRRNDCTDVQVVQSVQYWLQCYRNALILRERYNES